MREDQIRRSMLERSPTQRGDDETERGKGAMSQPYRTGSFHKFLLLRKSVAALCTGARLHVAESGQPERLQWLSLDDSLRTLSWGPQRGMETPAGAGAGCSGRLDVERIVSVSDMSASTQLKFGISVRSEGGGSVQVLSVRTESWREFEAVFQAVRFVASAADGLAVGGAGGAAGEGSASQERSAEGRVDGAPSGRSAPLEEVCNRPSVCVRARASWHARICARACLPLYVCMRMQVRKSSFRTSRASSPSKVKSGGQLATGLQGRGAGADTASQVGRGRRGV